MDATAAVSWSKNWTHRTATRFFGPSVISLPRASTLPTRCSGASPPPPRRAAFFPNSRSSMRIRSSLTSGSTARPSSSAAPHGTRPWSRPEWGPYADEPCAYDGGGESKL